MNPWAAIVGRRDAGRVRVARAVARALADRGLGVGGFVHASVDVGERHIGHDLLDLGSGQRWPLARVTPTDPDLCDYAFEPGAFERAAALLAAPGAAVVFAEAGRLEANGHGHWPGILAALEGPEVLVVLCIRPDALAPVALRLEDPIAGLELPADEPAVAAFVEALVAPR